MLPTFYVPVAPPTLRPTLVAETEVLLSPFPISVLDTQIIPSLGVPDSQVLGRSRAQTPKPRSSSRAATPLPPEVRLVLGSSRHRTSSSASRRTPGLDDDNYSELSGSRLSSPSLWSDSEGIGDDDSDLHSNADDEDNRPAGRLSAATARVLSVVPCFNPDDSKIPVPTGGPSRHLSACLGWEKTKFKRLQVCLSK